MDVIVEVVVVVVVVVAVAIIVAAAGVGCPGAARTTVAGYPKVLRPLW